MSLLKWMPLFVAGATIESFTQVCLKKGASEHKDTDGIKYYLKILQNRWVIAGISAYLVEMVLWIVLLSYIPLSVAFPLSGIQKIIIILFSVFVLREKANVMEWFGIGITILGIAIIVQAG